MRTAIILGSVVLFIGLVALFPHSMLEPGELVEAHQRTGNDCFSCHQPFGGLPDAKCIACHVVADIGKDTLLDQPPLLFHVELGAMACVECHSEHQGRNADLTKGEFDHELMSVSIMTDCTRCHEDPSDKLHERLPDNCVACHDTRSWERAQGFDHAVLPAATKADCAGCHERPADAVHDRAPDDCAKCHSTTAWKPASFDHGLLTTAEKNACAGCHAPPSDAFHKGTRENCSSCHGTNAWAPSTFDHSGYFRLDGDHNAKCITCHLSNNYNAYSCYGCHEHTVGNIQQEHREEGISNFTDCVRCHRSGDEDDIRNSTEGGRSGGVRKRNDDDD